MLELNRGDEKIQIFPLDGYPILPHESFSSAPTSGVEFLEPDSFRPRWWPRLRESVAPESLPEAVVRKPR